tara:strand:- start:17 stop:475 length:459 start_codon:yes stop_codon:yes gene_type:complete
MSNYEFKKDLIEGEEGESVVLKDLILMGAEFISDNKNNKYDLLVSKNGVKIKYEVKTDVYCKPNRDTGNMFVEFECRGKDSGIMVSEAKWFVMYYKFLDELWYIKTSDLIKLINESSFRTTNNSGDEGSNTKGYLIPRKSVTEYFKIRKING